MMMSKICLLLMTLTCFWMAASSAVVQSFDSIPKSNENPYNRLMAISDRAKSSSEFPISSSSQFSTEISSSMSTPVEPFKIITYTSYIFRTIVRKLYATSTATVTTTASNPCTKIMN